MASGNGTTEGLQDERLYGSWLVVGAKGYLLDADGNRTDVEGPQEGVLIFTPGHRMIAFALQPGRKPANNDEERLLLFKSMVTYSGKFRLEPGRYFLDTDWSSTALNTDETQIRNYKIDGDNLTIEVPLHKNIHDPTKQNSNILMLVREK